MLLLIREYADQIPHPDLPIEPRERVIVAATAIHEALAGWTWAAEVLTTDGFVARLGDSARWLVEVIVGGAVDHGCRPAEAVHVVRSIWYYTVGEILVRDRSARQPADHEGFARSLGASNLPHLAALADQWHALAAQDTYQRGLRALVDGLLADPR